MAPIGRFADAAVHHVAPSGAAAQDCPGLLKECPERLKKLPTIGFSTKK
jgi:hypothetical protein